MTPEANMSIVASHPGSMTRRTFIERAIAGGFTISVAGAILSACGGQQQGPSIRQITPAPVATETATHTSGEQIGGTPLAEATPLKNIDGTTQQYLSIEASVPKGHSLILALEAGTQQDVGVFDTQADEQTYKANHEQSNTPLYKQPNFYPEDTTQPYLLVLEQDTQDAYDLIILQRDGAKPSYEARVAPNDQVDTIIHQMQNVHSQLQGVQPFKETDYQYTLPTDSHFA
jgi:hypothetical protein